MKLRHKTSDNASEPVRTQPGRTRPDAVDPTGDPLPVRTNSREELFVVLKKPLAEDESEVNVEREANGESALDHGHRKSKLARTFFWILQITLALGVGYWFATTRTTPDARLELSPELTASATTESVSDAVPVTVAPVVERKIERTIEAVGNLHGYDELTLKTKISGRVANVLHDFADRVEPGDLLLEIDPTDAQLAVEQAKRSLSSELAKWGFQEVPSKDTDLTQLPTVVSARLRAEWSRSQLSRLVALQNRGSASQEEMEQAKTNSAVADSDYANALLLARSGAATAQLKKAELDIAEQQLKETRIYVPQGDGLGGAPNTQYTITERYVTEGDWLAAGSDLFRLVVEDTLKLRLSIPEKHAAAVRVGQRVKVSTLTSSEPAIGTVVRIGPAVDPETRTFQIEAEVPNANRYLKTGGFAKAGVIIDDASPATTVPVSALVTFAGIHKVFVLEGEKVREVKVKLGEQSSQWVEIVDSQLPAGAVIAVSGQSQLADGSSVRIREPNTDVAQSGGAQ